MAKRDYLLEAAKQIRMALDREVNEDYEAAFSYYKNGVDLLLNGVQVDPNKERREAVKRKTTQYLKRAEEIFISHLQDNLGKGSSHLGGYSSLRFRPIRHLSSPVEDLEMCKVVGVIDKVLVVQSLVNKETFVVKSLAKSSWESREQPTIIPQGVPYMVKLLRYYVSEDAVYLHLEHLQGGRLFSKLTKAQSHRAMEHPDCFSPNRVKLRYSYTSPSLSTPSDAPLHPLAGGTPVDPLTETQHSPDTEAGPSWEEAQRHLEGCGTHTYIEETGCLQNPRSTSSSSSSSSQGRSEVTPRLLPVSLHWPIRTHLHSANCHSSCSNEALPVPAPLLVSFARIGQAIDVVSELPGRTSGNGLLECSSDFELAWKSAAPECSCDQGREVICSPSDTHTHTHTETPASQPTLMSFGETGSMSINRPNKDSSSSPNPKSSSPAILHLHLDCQTHICGSGTVSNYGVGSCSGVGQESCTAHQNQPSPVITEEERRDTALIRSTDRAVFSDTHSFPIVSLPLSVGGAGSAPSSGRAGEVVEEAWELLSPGGKEAPVRDFSLDPQRRRGDMDAFLNSEGVRVESLEEQTMEVEGWCHLPSRGTGHQVRQACWGMPEAEVRVWGAQILLALESLHQQGILCRDLNPKNILLTSNGKVLLTFFSQWSEVQTEICSKAMQRMYCAPEIGGVSKPTEACDWWSLGALLFELLTGMPLWQFHPAGIHSHTQLLIPDNLSTAAASLLTELLQYDAGYRLGSGGGGVSDIKCHPFFIGVSWQALSY